MKIHLLEQETILHLCENRVKEKQKPITQDVEDD
jgi:hypothetical protein